MILVIDANILFSALLKPGIARALLLLSGHSFYAPDFTIQEFNKHLSELEAKTRVKRQELTEILHGIIAASGIKIVPFEEFKNWKKIAEEISPDKADVAYIALALHLKCPLWSNDKALKKQKRVKILSTKELLENIEKPSV